MRERVLVVSEVVNGGASLRFEGGYFYAVLREDHPTAAGWKVGDRVILEDSTKQPGGYDLTLERNRTEKVTVVSLQ